jgi:putative phosphoesterase
MLVGLLADTHVPYRAPSLPPALLESLSGVDLILHAGDVDEPWALAPLREIAPVYAVRGNYHWVERSDAGRSLPVSVELDLEGHRVAVIHGHQMGVYAFLWKVRALLRNLVNVWEFPAYDQAIGRRLRRRFPEADVIVFGHTHRYYLNRERGVTLINPGAALRTAYFGAPYKPSLARLVLEAGVLPHVERIFLPLAE